MLFFLINNMFGKCFFPYFLFSKIIFYFWNKKTYLTTQNGQKIIIILKTQSVKETENIQNVVFRF